MSIDRDTIRRLERLSCLTLSDGERDSLAADLERIVAYFRDIQSVDIRRAPDNLAAAPRLRDDTIADGLDREEILDATPDRDGGFFRVPPPFERGEE